MRGRRTSKSAVGREECRRREVRRGAARTERAGEGAASLLGRRSCCAVGVAVRQQREARVRSIDVVWVQPTQTGLEVRPSTAQAPKLTHKRTPTVPSISVYLLGASGGGAPLPHRGHFAHGRFGARAQFEAPAA